MAYRDPHRVEMSPTRGSPLRGGRASRPAPNPGDTLFSSTSTGARHDPDDDYLSPTSTSALSPVHRNALTNFSGTGCDEGSESNFKVVIRVRPPVQRELNGYRPYVDVVGIANDRRSITLCETLDTEDGRGGVYSRQTFTFDYVYGKQTLQCEVYERSAQPAVFSVMQGYNATLMAYGQTGTGKTYTMEGFTSEEQRGIIPRAIEELFTSINASRRENMRFLVRASYMQIYNEVISDLLKPTAGRALTVRHTPQRGVYVEGLSEWIVRSPHDVYGLIERGTSLRATSATRMSELSSRSHAMFTIIVEVMEGDETNPTSYRFGKLNIVDLAGSEKLRQASVTGQRLEETKKINKSLHELGNVIAALASKSGGRQRHVPFRNSVLTSALRDSLGGNCKTTLIACISPALESYTESLSTLAFANRAKNIKNTAFINEDLDQATLLRKYEQELKMLRHQLQERDTTSQQLGGGVDPGILSELRQGMRRAEEDCEAALEALQESSRAHQQELTVRKRFEERIQELEGMLQNGGFKGVPRTSDEYALRLDELDRERQVMEEEKAQVDRYKQLLLKQRDIMLNLTTRLNERDEMILQLQEEVDAYDAHIQTLEETLEVQQQQLKENLNSNFATPFSRARAEEYLQRTRVQAGADGGEVRYRSDANASVLLTAEAKMLELLLAIPHAPSMASPPSPLLPQQQQQQQTTTLPVDSAVQRQLVELVRERAEKMVREQLDSHIWQQCQELDSLRSRLLESEQKNNTIEKLLSGFKAQHPAVQDVVARTRRHIDEQQGIVRKTYEGCTQALHQQLAQEREQRMRLMNKVDTLTVQSRKALECCTNAAQRVEINNLCVALQQLEEHLCSEMKHVVETAVAARVSATHHSISVTSNSSSGNGRGNHSNNTTHTAEDAAIASSSTLKAAPPVVARAPYELEGQRKALQSSHAKKEEEWRRVVQEKDVIVRQLEEQLRSSHVGVSEEIETLTKSLNTHKKDRRALQTIMEQRVKVKVDAICELVAAGSQLSPQEQSRLCSEAQALQNLVNASIKAMES
ncbi:putative kinesin [Trypanosoma rangeli]|uniref:Putative kinesin n=1 Tax=Trypanosoma rangeli TaxID=5698 RepID=A0A3R7NW09_TRYRA|nr:putative kinesin [Trypanosoma rangeli]RNF12665.1 putative kinesin [Trypanosoma rangeli]|eukprot:RNF12665.1 putative kinesin [Trypanosoma rangeli]